MPGSELQHARFFATLAGARGVAHAQHGKCREKQPSLWRSLATRGLPRHTHRLALD